MSDRSELIAQALRFLTSARVTGDATDETKREFLRSKGLTKDEIETVFQDAQSPTTTASSPSVSQEDAYERAAREFDDPINVTPPPPTYPKSPLALYYEPQAPSAAAPTATRQETRYQVLLRFFKTMSYMMMLGGGATALCVALYRAYILPRITATFDARSQVLKHHHVLFEKLRDTVGSLATYAPKGAIDEAKKKGVLKKVHFGDEVDGGKLEQPRESEKVVTPGTDVVVDAPTEKTPLIEGEAEAEEAEAEDKPPKLESIDVTEPIRSSLARLAAALKADMSSSAAPAPESRTATVADEEEEEEDSNSDDDDGLEFDPYGAYQKKKKHTQAPQSSRDPASALSTALSGLSLDIHSHRVSQNTYSSSANLMRIGGTSTAGSGDIGQVRAEIRSLKGLLLSRRNFPSYARPGAMTNATPPPPPTSTVI